MVLAFGCVGLVMVASMIVVMGSRRLRHFQKMRINVRDSTFDDQVQGKRIKMSYRMGSAVDDDAIASNNRYLHQFDLQTPTENKTFTLRVPLYSIKVQSAEELQRASATNLNGDVTEPSSLNQEWNEHMFDEIKLT